MSVAMPSIDENLRHWDPDATWVDDGDEWSRVWGGPEAQWHGCIAPRLRPHLPASTILEIATGRGRWTRFLLPECERFIGVDLSPRCVAACRQRFQDTAHAEFHVNDGRSLEFVADDSVDLAFSVDSLVHVEADVLSSYVDELARTLSPTGVAFIHHSNLAAHGRRFGMYERIPPRLRQRMTDRGLIDHSHLRASTVSAEWFRDRCALAGLVCAGQELVNWGTKRLIDCFSVVVRPASTFARPTRVVNNPFFMDEARSIARWQDVHLAPG